MDYFGINSPEELPKIREVMPDEAVEPTAMKNALFGQEPKANESDVLSVTEGGELIINKDINEDEDS